MSSKCLKEDLFPPNDRLHIGRENQQDAIYTEEKETKGNSKKLFFMDKYFSDVPCKKSSI